MNPQTIIGVSRGNKYSPNHVDNDAVIFSLVGEELKKMGYDVLVYPEETFTDKAIRADLFFCMARAPKTLSYLKYLEDGGALVVNSAYGIASCVRKPMTQLLLSHHIPHPKSWIISTDEPFDPPSFPCWFKRGDSQTIFREDVCYVTNPQEALATLTDFRHRGIPSAVINEHLAGDLIKFYGVQGTDFFHWFYPSPSTHSKFGLEKINGEAHGYPFDASLLKQYADQAAAILNVPIYGGDCIVRPDGSPLLIDFNDWPSFLRCRGEAAPYIAQCIHSRVLLHNQD